MAHAVVHRGFLSDEEEILYQLRQEKEGEARRVLEQERDRLERESKLSQVHGAALAPVHELWTCCPSASHMRPAHMRPAHMVAHQYVILHAVS